MIRLWYRPKLSGEANTCTFTREGQLVLLSGLVQLETASPVAIQVLCCHPSKRHQYRSGVYALTQKDSSTWIVEHGPHVVQDEFTQPIYAQILVCQAPEEVDLFALATPTRWAA